MGLSHSDNRISFFLSSDGCTIELVWIIRWNWVPVYAYNIYDSAIHPQRNFITPRLLWNYCVSHITHWLLGPSISSDKMRASSRAVTQNGSFGTWWTLQSAMSVLLERFYRIVSPPSCSQWLNIYWCDLIRAVMATSRGLWTPGQDPKVCWHWPRRIRRREKWFPAPRGICVYACNQFSSTCLANTNTAVEWIYHLNIKSSFSLLLTLLGTGRDTEYTGSGQPPGTDQLLGSDGRTSGSGSVGTQLTTLSRVSVLAV